MMRLCQILLVAGAVLLTGCATRASLERPPVDAGYCSPPLPGQRDANRFQPPGDMPEMGAGLLAQYPRRTLLVAHAAGILPTLQQLEASRTAASAAGSQPDLAEEVAILKKRQFIIGRLFVLSSTIASIAAELDCEGERADQLGAYLAQLDTDRTQRLNVLSIVVGAISGIGTTVSNSRSTQYAFGVGGGLTGAGLGIFSLVQDTGTHTFEHRRNLLTDVWNETENSTAWPPGIWYMLTEPAFSNEGKTSIAHNTRLRWQQYGHLAHLESREGQRLERLLFGVGGDYSADALTMRANMLNQLQSSVRLLNQELQGLLSAFTQD